VEVFLLVQGQLGLRPAKGKAKAKFSLCRSVLVFRKTGMFPEKGTIFFRKYGMVWLLAMERLVKRTGMFIAK